MNMVDVGKMTEAQKKKFLERKVQEQALRQKVMELYEECALFDDGVRTFFNIESNKMLGKKVKVLKLLKDGKDPDEIGKAYYDILEDLDVPDGEAVEIRGQIYDPHKYDR